jgi:hypothetical protein
MNTSRDLQNWQVVAASVRGVGHERQKQLCQDAHYWEVLPEGVLVAAVADGAGSAKMGKVGAIVAAQTAVETICLKRPTFLAGNSRGYVGVSLALSDEEGARALLSDALTAAKATVEAEAQACSLTSKDLATTLIVVIATPELIAAAQIGDGVVVAEDERGNFFALTTPQNGEYVNETTFLTSQNALTTAEFTLWRGAVAHLALLTDGLQMLALEMNERQPHKPFFSPLFQFVTKVTDKTEANEKLAAFLRSERIAERTEDDLTILLATFVGRSCHAVATPVQQTNHLT